MSVKLTVCDSVQSLFLANGLDNFEIFQTGDLGKVLSWKKSGWEVRRIVLHGEGGPEGFYLKRTGNGFDLRPFSAIFSGCRLHCAPLRELAAIRLLQQKGFAVMDPVAWGERRRYGLPACGFLVVREVCGDNVAQLYASSRGPARLALLEEVGQLTGRLHAAGFYQVVRMKDLIREGKSRQLVLIDRETTKPWLSRFSKKQAVATLARACRRTFRDGHRFGPATLRHFLAGYSEGVKGVWNVSAVEMQRLLLGELRRELGRHG